MMNALSDLEDFLHEKKQEWPVLVKAALIHAQFETIHPFLDGNGRIGRLLITLYLIKEKVLPRPTLYLSQYFKKNRKDYYKRLNEYRKNEVEQWILFFLKGIREVSRDSVKKAKKIMTLQQSDLELVNQFGNNSPKAHKVLRKLYQSPFVNAKTIGEITGLKSRTNIYNLIRKFERANILRELPGKKNKVFFYEKYLKLFEK